MHIIVKSIKLMQWQSEKQFVRFSCSTFGSIYTLMLSIRLNLIAQLIVSALLKIVDFFFCEIHLRGIVSVHSSVIYFYYD